MRVVLMLGLAALVSAPLISRAGADEPAARSVLEEQIATELRGKNKLRLEEILMGDISVVRNADREGDGLDAADVKFFMVRKEASKKALRASLFYSRDFDADGKVTRDEFNGIPNESVNINSRSAFLQSSAFAYFDTNHDGVLTFEEMMSAPDIPPGDAIFFIPDNDIPRLMELDPDKDGKLKVPELIALVLSTFAKFDKNGDGSIDSDEAREIPK